MMINIKLKAQTTIVFVSLLLASAHSFWYYSQKLEELEKSQHHFEQQISRIDHHFMNEMMIIRFSYELTKILVLPEVMDALVERDRDKLYPLVEPSWALLKAENRHIKIMHFHRADGVTLLRMHRPDRFGDPIAEERPLLAEMHRLQKRMYRFEAGKHGMFLRVILPIISNGAYLGAIELGVDAAYVLDGFHQMSGLEGFLFVEQRALEILYSDYIKDDPEIDYFIRNPVDGMILWSMHDHDSAKNDHFSGKSGGHDNGSASCGCLDSLKGEGQRLTALSRTQDREGNSYIVHILSLPVMEGAPKAKVLLFQDITDELNSINLSLIVNLGVAVTLLIAVLLVLHYATTALLNRLAHYVYLSGTDSLTLLPNRRKFNQHIDEEIQRSSRYNTPFSVIVLDIDHFKRVNDLYGHDVGDRVLEALSGLLAGVIRKSDFLARWGGEEFVVLLPSQTLKEAEKIAEKLRTTVENHSFKEVRQVTVSLGVSEWWQDEDSQALFKRADNNLLQAKQQGRNRTVAA